MAHDDPHSLPNRVATGFAKISLVLRHEAWRAAGQRGLTPTQEQILVFLLQSTQPPGLKAVSEALALTAGTTSEAISTLESKGLVTKARAEHDKRAMILKLTASGRRQARQAARWPDSLLSAADTLAPSEQSGLVRGLVGMVRSLQQQGLVPADRMCVECRHFRPHAHGDGRHHCNYVDAPLGDADLRFSCGDMEPLDEENREQLWQLFVEGKAPG